MTNGAAANLPQEDVAGGKIFAILGYICCIFWLIPIIKKDNAFSLYHAKQALGLTIIGIVLSIACNVLAFIPAIGIIFGLLGMVIGLVLLVFAILGIVNAAGGHYKPLPVVGAMIDEKLASMQKA